MKAVYFIMKGQSVAAEMNKYLDKGWTVFSITKSETVIQTVSSSSSVPTAPGFLVIFNTNGIVL